MMNSPSAQCDSYPQFIKNPITVICSLSLIRCQNSSSSRRYSPGLALTSSTIRLHWSLFLASSIHPLIPILLGYAITFPSHLTLLLLIQSALQPLWVWSAQLSLSILSRKVFTECRCQQHVKPLTWKTIDLNVPTLATRCPQRLKRRERTPAAEGGTKGEKFPRILPKVATSTSLLGSITCRKFTTWDRRLYFPSEGRSPKNATASAGFEPANLGTKGQHAHI